MKIEFDSPDDQDDDCHINPYSMIICRRNHLGTAVYAIRLIDEGEIIGLIDGDVIDDPNYSSEYCIDLENGKSLEPAAPFCFVNHSCEPNAELLSWEDDDGTTGEEVWLVAVKPIPSGTEVTIDYGWPAESAIRCGCGAADCRGWVVASEEVANVKIPAEEDDE